MEEKIFSKRLFPIILFTSATIVSVALLVPRKKLQPQSNRSNQSKVLSSRLDLGLKNQLGKELEQAISLYPTQGWWATYQEFEKVRQACEDGDCDFETFFNEYLDRLAEISVNNRDLVNLGSVLGLIYEGNWEIADLNQDQQDEVVILQRDILNSSFTTLKVIDFQGSPRIKNYVIKDLGYFGSPNSTRVSLPLKILDLDSDSKPEILTFLSTGRGGAHLLVFSYQGPDLKLTFRTDKLTYAKYTFTDLDGDGILEIIVEGYDAVTKEPKRIVTKL